MEFKEGIKAAGKVIVFFFACLGGVLTFLNIYDRITTSKVCLEASVTYNSALYPTNMLSDLENLPQDILSIKNYVKYRLNQQDITGSDLHTKVDGNLAILDKTVERSNNVLEYLDINKEIEKIESKYNKLPLELKNYTGVYTIELTNKGKLRCKDIKFAIPDSMYIEIVNGEHIVASKYKDYEVTIDEILPNSTVYVKAWAPYNENFITNGLTISHASGIADVVVKNKHKNGLWIWMIPIINTVLLLMFIEMLRKSRELNKAMIKFDCNVEEAKKLADKILKERESMK